MSSAGSVVSRPFSSPDVIVCSASSLGSSTLLTSVAGLLGGATTKFAATEGTESAAAFSASSGDNRAGDPET